MDAQHRRITLRDVGKAFVGRSGEPLPVLRSVSLDIATGQFNTLVGPNGCGKTTLLNVIAGLITPDCGTVSMEGVSESSFQVGYVWQDYRATILPWLDVADNVAFPLRLRRVARKERRKAATAIVREFLPNTDPAEPCYRLSGGQQQLVSVLRSIVAEPDVLLLDEPLSALDQQRRWGMCSFIEKAWLKREVPILFVSHDIDEAVLLADRILLMSARCGSIVRVVNNPLPRPRNHKMLTASEHLECRRDILAFLMEERALGNAVGTLGSK